jgi:hypothetical protein
MKNLRTPQQNRALHKYYQILADALNDAGLDMRVVLKPEVDIPWTKDTIKEQLWRPIQKAQLLKESTTQMTTKEVDKVKDTLERHLGQKFGVDPINFPSMEDIIRQIEYEKRNK